MLKGLPEPSHCPLPVHPHLAQFSVHRQTPATQVLRWALCCVPDVWGLQWLVRRDQRLRFLSGCSRGMGNGPWKFRAGSSVNHTGQGVGSWGPRWSSYPAKCSEREPKAWVPPHPCPISSPESCSLWGGSSSLGSGTLLLNHLLPPASQVQQERLPPFSGSPSSPCRKSTGLSDRSRFEPSSTTECGVTSARTSFPGPQFFHL